MKLSLLAKELAIGSLTKERIKELKFDKKLEKREAETLTTLDNF